MRRGRNIAMSFGRNSRALNKQPLSNAVDSEFERKSHSYSLTGRSNPAEHIQPADIGWTTGNGKKISNSQACCLAAAYFVGHPMSALRSAGCTELIGSLKLGCVGFLYN